MKTKTNVVRRATSRDLLFFRTPKLWPQHPFLPVVRRPVGQTEPDLGLLYDARAISGTCGFSATVFLVNVFELPPEEAELLASPKLVYDTADELAEGGWTVD